MFDFIDKYGFTWDEWKYFSKNKMALRCVGSANAGLQEQNKGGIGDALCLAITPMVRGLGLPDILAHMIFRWKDAPQPAKRALANCRKFSREIFSGEIKLLERIDGVYKKLGEKNIYKQLAQIMNSYLYYNIALLCHSEAFKNNDRNFLVLRDIEKTKIMPKDFMGYPMGKCGGFVFNKASVILRMAFKKSSGINETFRVITDSIRLYKMQYKDKKNLSFTIDCKKFSTWSRVKTIGFIVGSIGAGTLLFTDYKKAGWLLLGSGAISTITGKYRENVRSNSFIEN